MPEHVCPWFLGYFIDNRLRRWLHNPDAIVEPYVGPGMTVLDIGCGMGIFTLAMARRVGPIGRVIAIDLQPQMVQVLQRRAAAAGVADRIRTHLATPTSLGLWDRDVATAGGAPLTGACDFALMFAMLHEVPDPARLLAEVSAVLQLGGRLLIAEPRLHVPAGKFADELGLAVRAGLAVVARPHIRWSHAAALQRDGSAAGTSPATPTTDSSRANR